MLAPLSWKSMPGVLPVLVIPCMGVRLGLPLTCVAEVFRPLPTTNVPGAPDFVLGMAQVRGEATVVLDLNRLLGADKGVEAQRYVRLRVDKRSAVLAVEGASELQGLDSDALKALPP
ncbi:MAG: chemotaxis protein CheW, partial [bacterium]